MEKNDEQLIKWTEEWLNSVADGTATMSQRRLSSIDKRGGGIQIVKQMARQKGVHLLQITDDKGNDLVAASTKPFTVIC